MKKKQAKRDFKGTEIKKETFRNEDYQKVISFLIVLVIVVATCGALYFLNGKYITKDEFQNTTTTTEVPSYDDTVITIDKMFKLSGSYMVMLFDSSNKADKVLYSNLVTTYGGDTKLYSVDLNNQMNKENYDKKGKENTKPTSKKDLVITRPTLITFKDGKVVSYETNQDTIVKQLSKSK